jgi:hypothetical protein
MSFFSDSYLAEGNNARIRCRKKGRSFLHRKKCDAFYGQLDVIVSPLFQAFI